MGLLDFAQSASNAAASNVSGPVDLLAWALRKAGVPVGDAPVGSSAWMAQKGLTREVPQSASSLAGETFGLLAPVVAAAKAPQIAKGLLQAGENLAAPANVNRGASSGQRGIFMGDLSKTWDKDAAAKAQAMEKAGKGAREIWKETGTFKGVDGKWRQEIDDSAAALRDYQFTPMEAYKDAQWRATVGDGDHVRALGMRDYAGMSKRQLIDEYARTGREIVDAALGGDKELAFQLNANRQGLTDLLSQMGARESGPASAWLKHGELGQAYPDVYRLHTRISADDVGGAAAHYLRGNAHVGEQVVMGKKPVWKEDKSTMLHELQHAIQQREGFARGGSPEQFNVGSYESLVKRSSSAQDAYIRAKANGGIDPETGLSIKNLRDSIDQLTDQIKSWTDPMESYRRLAGEAEARATQTRMNMTPAERRATFPFDSYDVPVDSLIVRGLLK